MTNGQWQRVTVVGCGLIGASFALALRRDQLCARLAGWDVCPATLAEALKRGIIDEVDQAFADRDGISTADLLYLAMPVGEIISFLRARGGQIKPGAVVTDAGSTKVEVCRAARRHLPQERRFVGGHPVAGSHLIGLAHAHTNLFKGAPYVLTTDDDVGQEQARMALAETLGLLGARVTLLTAEEHDRALALVSHLPQLVSGALTATINAQPDAAALLALSGAGYRDMTRLAASSWSMWQDILATNSAHVAASLDALIAQLATVRDELWDYSTHDSPALVQACALFSATRQPGALRSDDGQGL